MTAEQQQKQQNSKQTTLRIYTATKKRLQTVVYKLTGEGLTKVSEVQIADEILKAGLPEYEHKLGIKIQDI